VILALTPSAIKSTLEALAGELKAGCVIMDTASIKVPVLAWSEETLPPGVHFVGTNPIVSSEDAGGKAARANLFEKATWAICPTPTTDETAVKMAADLAQRLQAKPLFLEAQEHDGMLAAVEHLPAMVSMALLSSVISQPSWREMRKLAGGQFESSTHLAVQDPQALVSVVRANQEHLVRWLDSFVENLQGWRQLIQAGDDEGLEEIFSAALAARDRWLNERRTGFLDDAYVEMPQTRTMFLEMLGMGRLASRKPKQPDQR
jgi:prephenate dehydrogenase